MKSAESPRNTTPNSDRESTEISLFVRTSDEEIKKWDKSRIFDALMRETDISEDAAAIVAREVEKMIGELQLDVITAPLIRELTNAKLVEYGLAKIRRQHTRLGVPLYDARQIIMSPNKENANVPHGPEATNLTLAEQIKKEFALLEVFSQDLADAHMRGDIHLHDLGMVEKQLNRDTSLYNKYFGPQRFAGQPWYGGHLGETNDNNYCYFDAGGMQFMVLSLEYSPRDETLAWAAEVAARHPRHRVILVTHCYMRPKGRDSQTGGVFGNSGDGVWEKLVRRAPNIFLVVSGHVLGVGRQVSVNEAGLPVHETLVDYQGLPNGGDGWLRIMRFIPSQDRIEVRAYSPLLDETMEDQEHTFSLEYSMTAPALRKAG